MKKNSILIIGIVVSAVILVGVYAFVNFHSFPEIKPVISSDGIFSTAEIGPEESYRIDVSMTVGSKVGFWFSYKDTILVDYTDKSRSAINELLYVEVYDPHEQLIENITARVPQQSSQFIGNSVHFTPLINGSYSAVIFNLQDKPITVKFGFGDVKKIAPSVYETELNVRIVEVDQARGKNYRPWDQNLSWNDFPINYTITDPSKPECRRRRFHRSEALSQVRLHPRPARGMC